MATAFKVHQACGPTQLAPKATKTSGDAVGGKLNLSEEVYPWDTIRRRFERFRVGARNDRIIFYRHGATNYNRRNLVSGQHNTALSQEGRADAANLAARIPEQVHLIVSSKLGRAIQTMELAVPGRVRSGVPTFEDGRLNEVHLGVLQGRKRRHLPEFESGDLDFAPVGGESYRTAAARVYSAVSDIFGLLARGGGEGRTALVFCHAGVLRIVAALINRSDDPSDVFKKSPRNAERLEVVSCDLRLADFWRG